MAEKEQFPVLKGPVCEMVTGKREDDTPIVRRWIVVNLPYGIVRRITRSDRYNPDTGRGEQRAGIESWQKKLAKAQQNGTFTPTPYAAGLRESHRKQLKFTNGDKHVEFHVDNKNPLPLIDGQQRSGAREMMRKNAEPDEQKRIDSDIITLVVYLDYRKVDFDNLQEGRPVNKSHRLSMRLREGLVDAAKAPFLQMAQQVLTSLNNNPESHLDKQVKFDSGSSAPLEFSSLATLGGSDIATSIVGGTKIALYENQDFPVFAKGKQRTAAWLASMQVHAYQAIRKYGDKVELTNPVDGSKTEWPKVLQRDYVLCPAPNGTKGGSSLLIGLGNMLAFRMAWQDKDEPQPKDLKHFVEAVQDTFDIELEGGFSGPMKRQLMGDFCRRYFADIVQQEGEEHQTKKLVPIDNGIPYLLTLMLTRSTFAVPKTARPGYSTSGEDNILGGEGDAESAAEEDEVETEEGPGFIDTSEEDEEEASSGKKSRGRRLPAVSG